MKTYKLKGLDIYVVNAANVGELFECKLTNYEIKQLLTKK